MGRVDAYLKAREPPALQYRSAVQKRAKGKVDDDLDENARHRQSSGSRKACSGGFGGHRMVYRGRCGKRGDKR